MKLKTILSSVFFLTLCSTIFGQEQQTESVKRISIHDIFIQPGFFIEKNSNGTLQDFRTLAPKSVLLDNNLTDYSSSNGFNLTTTPMFSFMLGITFSDKKKASYKANPLLRLGVNYFSATTLTGSLYKEERKTYDTLSSPQTGQVYLDSITSKSYNINYSSQQLRFDASLLFRTDPEARWSLFTGIGLTAGLSINANTDIYYNKFERSEARYPNGNNSSTYSYSGPDNSKTERYKNKNNFGFSTYIPLGVDFRLGKKREFWKRTHLFYELRPGINFTSIPELRTVTNASIQHGVGLRVSWN